MISVCMIVKNEIAVLERCILSVKDKLKDLVNEIVIVDTGSTDGTKELATKLGCRVFDFEWCNDFAKARNYSVEKANNDLILVLDADEFVVEVDMDKLEMYIKSKNSKLIGEVKIVNYGNKSGERYNIIDTGRMFNRVNIRYRRKIHEIPDTMDESDADLTDTGIVIHHTGYIEETKNEKGKAERNLSILLETVKAEDDMYLRMHLGKTYIDLEKYDLAFKELEEVLNNKESFKYSYYTESAKEYARCFLNAEKFEEAIVCEKYWDRCKRDDGFVYFLGHIYFRNGFYEKAMDCFVDVINRKETRINKKDAMYSLAQMFSLLGFNEESAYYYNMCGNYADAIELAEVELSKKK